MNEPSVLELQSLIAKQRQRRKWITRLPEGAVPKDVVDQWRTIVANFRKASDRMDYAAGLTYAPRATILELIDDSIRNARAARDCLLWSLPMQLADESSTDGA